MTTHTYFALFLIIWALNGCDHEQGPQGWSNSSTIDSQNVQTGDDTLAPSGATPNIQPDASAARACTAVDCYNSDGDITCSYRAAVNEFRQVANTLADSETLPSECLDPCRALCAETLANSNSSGAELIEGESSGTSSEGNEGSSSSSPEPEAPAPSINNCAGSAKLFGPGHCCIANRGESVTTKDVCIGYTRDCAHQNTLGRVCAPTLVAQGCSVRCETTRECENLARSLGQNFLVTSTTSKVCCRPTEGGATRVAGVCTYCDNDATHTKTSFVSEGQTMCRR